MNSTPPPPSSNAEAAFRTYFRAVVFLLPAFVVWLFTRVILLPRLAMVWERAGIAPSQAPRAQFLLVVSNEFGNRFWLIFVLGVVFVVVLDLSVSQWRRHRRTVVGAMTFLLNAGVLIGLAVVTTTALFAAPIALKSK